MANTQKPTPKYDLPYTPAQKWKIIHTMEEINLNAGYKLNDLAQRIIDQDVLPDWKLTSAQASKLIAGLTKINQQLKSWKRKQWNQKEFNQYNLIQKKM